MSMSIVVQFGPGLQEEDANMGEYLLKNYIAGGRWSWQMVIFPCPGKNDNLFWPWQKKRGNNHCDSQDANIEQLINGQFFVFCQDGLCTF